MKATAGPLLALQWCQGLGRTYPDLTPGDIAVGLLLATYADLPTGTGAWPSQVTLADALGFHDRAVRRSLKRLESVGAITCTGRKHRVKVWSLNPNVTGPSEPVTSEGNRTERAGYATTKPDRAGHVTGPSEPRNRTERADNQSDQSDHEGGLTDDDALRAAPEGATLRIETQRLDALLALLPTSWQGVSFRKSHDGLAEAVAAIDRDGWTEQQIRLGLSTLGNPAKAKNPTALLATHIGRMVTAGPDDVVTVPTTSAATSTDWRGRSDIGKIASKLQVDPKALTSVADRLTADGYEVQAEYATDRDPLGASAEVLALLPEDRLYSDDFAAALLWDPGNGRICYVRLPTEAAELVTANPRFAYEHHPNGDTTRITAVVSVAAFDALTRAAAAAVAQLAATHPEGVTR